jgi:hypothetical protein
LTVIDTGYSEDWVGPRGGEHVIVDGIFNGWLSPEPPAEVMANYRYAEIVESSVLVSTSTLILVWVTVSVLCIWKSFPRHLRRDGSDTSVPTRIK